MSTENLVEALRAGVAYSHNHATASPFIRAVDKEHVLGLCALVERAIEALASRTEQPSAQAGEVVGFRFRIKGSADKWTYTTHRSPDSFELRECEIQNIFAAPQPPASARITREAWQPIETAPQDGFPRLYLVGGFCVQGFVDVCGTLHAQNDRQPWRKMRGKPTHWMPLPKLPRSLRLTVEGE